MEDEERAFIEYFNEIAKRIKEQGSEVKHLLIVSMQSNNIKTCEYLIFHLYPFVTFYM